jgi:hypothetical protein
MSHDQSSKWSFTSCVTVTGKVCLASPVAVLLFDLQQLKMILPMGINCLEAAAAVQLPPKKRQKTKSLTKGCRKVTALDLSSR